MQWIQSVWGIWESGDGRFEIVIERGLHDSFVTLRDWSNNDGLKYPTSVTHAKQIAESILYQEAQ